MADDGPVAIVHPKVVAIFVEDEKLRRQARGQRPFPLGHDRLGAADHAGDRVAVAREFAIEPGSSRASAVISDAVNESSREMKPIGQTRIASNQIDEYFIPVSIPDTGNEPFKQIT